MVSHEVSQHFQESPWAAKPTEETGL